ncbi:organomercurial lyase [Streptomyces nojiriensis]|uniref:hypothetical protein n=1 Tax=Streptomyces nojiriensis TaxID=66374 RepID=UPI002E17B079
MTTGNASTASLDLDRTERVRLAVYRGFARTGQAPGVAELAALTGLGPDRVRRELRTLHERHDLVLDREDSDHVVRAHPFASVPLGFSVMGTRTLWWGGCAWDSFAMPHLLRDEPDVVATRCPACDTPHARVVGRDAPPEGDQVGHATAYFAGSACADPSGGCWTERWPRPVERSEAVAARGVEQQEEGRPRGQGEAGRGQGARGPDDDPSRGRGRSARRRGRGRERTVRLPRWSSVG